MTLDKAAPTPLLASQKYRPSWSLSARETVKLPLPHVTTPAIPTTPTNSAVAVKNGQNVKKGLDDFL